MRCAAASNKTPWHAANAQATPSTRSSFSCTPLLNWSRSDDKERFAVPFAVDKTHIGVEVTYHRAGQVPEVFHQDTPEQGRRLAASLIERLPSLSHSRERQPRGGPCGGGRTRSWPPSAPTVPATIPQRQPMALSDRADDPQATAVTPTNTDSACFSSQDA